MSPWSALASGLVGGYLLGAIPASWLVARLGWGVDLRRVGSGNPGATNALRALGPKAGVPALVLDMLKGSLAVGLGMRLPEFPAGLDRMTGLLLCGCAAVVGHTFPVFLGFRGGKGVATAAGVMFVLAPRSVLLSLAVFGLTVGLTRYASLGSILGAASFPVWVSLLAAGGRGPLMAVGVALALFITIRHRANIARLLAGTENRLGAAPLAGSDSAGGHDGPVQPAPAGRAPETVVEAATGTPGRDPAG